MSQAQPSLDEIFGNASNAQTTQDVQKPSLDDIFSSRPNSSTEGLISGQSSKQLEAPYKPKFMDMFKPSKEYLNYVGLTPEVTAKNREQLLPMMGATLASEGGPATMAIGAGLGQTANQLIKTLPSQTMIPNDKPNFGVNPLTDPIGQTTALTYAGGKALEAISGAAQNIISGKFRLPDFGGDAKLRNIAMKAKGALDSVYSKFSNQYDQLFEKFGNKPLTPDMIKPVQDAALNALDDVPMGSNAEKYLSKLIERPENITAKELHNLKQEIFKRSKGFTPGERDAMSGVYDAASEVLGSDNVLGNGYTQLSGKYKDFVTKEAKYVEDFIMDKFNQPTEQYLKGGMDLNAKDAFNKLSARTGTNLVPEVNAVHTGTNIKKIAGLGTLEEATLGIGRKTLGKIFH